MLLKVKNRYRPIIFALSLLCIFFVLLVDRSAIISYFYTLSFVLAISLFCPKEYRIRNILYFHFYLLLAILVFVIQRLQMPTFMGLSGPDGIGTDDGTYYAGVADGPIMYDDARLDIADNMAFCHMLRFLYPFRINGPLCVVIFCLTGITFLPYLTSRVAFTIFKDNNVAERAEKLMLFCPFAMSMGLIIMRDVICTTLLMAAFLNFLKKKYVFFALFAVLLGYLKFGFLAILLVPVLVFYINSAISRGKTLFVIKVLALLAILVVVGRFIFPYVTILSQGKLEDGIFRSSAIDFYLEANDKSVLAKICSYPPILRYPLLTIAFLIIPTLGTGFMSNGIFVPRLFLMGFLAPIYWWFLYRSFFNLFLVYKKLCPDAKALLYTILLMALTLGVISVQVRHRITIMPFFYIAVAYTGLHFSKYNRPITAVLISLFIAAQIVFVL